MRKSLICVLMVMSASQLAANYYAQFPIKISKNRKHLVDSRGQPFLMNADSGWLLLQKLGIDEVQEYFVKRKRQAFNTIFIQLLPPEPGETNFYEQAPFHKPDDFSLPNENYFDHVAAVLAEAQKQNLLVAINPAWLGCCGGNWAKAQLANGDSVCNKYGQYLGERFKKFDNVVWIMGGDRDPLGEEEAVRAMAYGIRSQTDEQLMTYHAASSRSSTDVFMGEPWLDFSMVYTYFRGKTNAWTTDMPQVYEIAQKEYRSPKPTAFVLGEAQYENEDVGNAQMMRRQAYWTMLAGGSGHCYGSTVWKFDKNWRVVSNLPGALQMQHFYKLMSGLPWEHFVPDTQNQFVVDGQSPWQDPNYVAVASLSNRKLMVAYIPQSGPLQIDFGQLKGKRLRVNWYSPRTGKKWVTAHYAPSVGVRQVVPPTIGDDWLLVIGNVSKD